MSSASVIFGVIPTDGRHRVTSGRAFNSSSIFTYSAVARVSRSVCTLTSAAMLLSNADHGPPSIFSTYPTRHIIHAPLGIGHLAQAALRAALPPQGWAVGPVLNRGRSGTVAR